MSKVYRARDTERSRSVGLKVLPARLASDEAQVLASLNHPNIATIYGVQDNAIVMERVEGPDPRRARHGARKWNHPPRPETRERENHPERFGQVLDFGLAKSQEYP